jgi:hypothetical protein
MSSLMQSLISQLSEFFDPNRLGPVLAGYLVNLLVSTIVLLGRSSDPGFSHAGKSAWIKRVAHFSRP